MTADPASHAGVHPRAPQQQGGQRMIRVLLGFPWATDVRSDAQPKGSSAVMPPQQR